MQISLAGACSKSILPVRERRFSERDIREPGSCDDILTLASASVEPDRAARAIEICCHIWPLLEIVGLSGPPSGPAHREVPGIDCSTQIRGRPYYHGCPGTPTFTLGLVWLLTLFAFLSRGSFANRV